jgi:glycolate oxidase FAD binding subunit
VADLTERLVEQVRAASADRTPLRIVGGDTKKFLGRVVPQEVSGTNILTFGVGGHQGIVHYDPAELVITARGGTPLREIEDALAAKGQHLPFEPPAFGNAATIGGTVAAGLAGPARHASGPLRDYVLGTRILTGDGRVLRFGGEVMKNVAGYDLSRLMAGSLGILGVLLDVSIKVLPRAPASRTLALAVDQADALRRMQQLARIGLPISASAWHAGRWSVRLESSQQALDAGAAQVGGEVVYHDAGFWRGLREQTAPFFANAAQLWRVTLPAHTPPLAIESPPCIEWNGMQRWYADVDAERLRAMATTAGGHVTCFRGASAGAEVFAPLPAALLRLHKSLKSVFDPAGLLNPGRMYADL